MFQTPPQRKMVNTRSTTRKNREMAENINVEPGSSRQPEHPHDTCWKVEITPTEDKEKSNVKVPSQRRTKSSTSSVLARRKKLELAAAEAKARIEMELIDKRLAADLADLEYSSQSDGSKGMANHTNVEVEKWLDHSRHELEAQAVPQPGTKTGHLDPPPPPAPHAARDDGTTDGTVHMLAAALKDLAATATANGSNAQMLSRMCIPRELPTFSGDPLEWLQFKQAYKDSTKMCNFSDQENLWRLRKCLHGSAKDTVTALLISATSPEIVMSSLELQYGNPDIIISRIMYEIRKLPSMAQEYHKEIVTFSIKVQNYVAAVLAIGQEEYLKGTSIISVILSKLPTVLISKWADYSYPLINREDKPKLVILSEFLSDEAVKISKTSVNIAYYNPGDYRRKQNDYRTHTVLVQNDVSRSDECKFCRIDKHKLTNCKKFKRALRKDRWLFVKRYGLCYKCLVSRHNREQCTAPVCDKDNCGQSHHRLLHNITTYARSEQCLPSGDKRAEVISERSNSVHNSTPPPRDVTVTHIQTNSSKVLLKTVPICVHGPNGVLKTIALLDDGSTVSIISETLVKKLRLSGSKQTLRVRGAWDNSELVCDSEIVNLNVTNMEGTMFTLKARSTSGLNLPTQYVSIDELLPSVSVEHIRHLLSEGQCKPEILIGQDNYNLLLPLEVTQSKPSGPYITRTPLGWCVHGRNPASLVGSDHHSTLLLSTGDNHGAQQEEQSILHELHEEVRRSFSIDAMGISGKPRQNSEHVRAIQHLEKTSSLKDGRWHVGLPWKDVNCTMPESYSQAYRRLQGVARKCKANHSYAERYNERIDHLLQNNYAHEVHDVKLTPHTWYLPHFGVDNPNKNKLRLVFDAAAKSKGFSLNDYLLTGPDLLVSLYGIMMRFRENEVAVTGDISDMFLRIKIIPEDQDALRFIWGKDKNIKTYAMSSLLFGANCSPFIAQFIKNKNAMQYESSKPEAVNAICKQHYMDDYIDSVDNECTAIQLIQDVIDIHRQGGFVIRNWTSNCETVINSLPKESLCPNAVKFKVGQQQTGARTLGLIWYPKEDELGFDVSFKRIPECIINGTKRPTKREMLSLVMSIFDVYGFLSPFTIRGRILLQEMWKTKLHWDEEIPDSTYIKWLSWLSLLKRINNIRIPRCYHSSMRASEIAINALNALNNSRRPEGADCTAAAAASAAVNRGVNDTCCTQISNITHRSYTNLQLHIFCDASTQAMCAVAYWRWLNNDAFIQLAFITSKCRVAPVKPTSVPRLELQAALLASRLAHTIIKEHKMEPQEKYFWCDSSTVLHWIRNDARDYKPYIAHRLGEIDELTSMKEWRYIPTKMNVADYATRDTCELNILQKEWLFGPEFLHMEKQFWPEDIHTEVCSEALERVTVVCEPLLPDVPDPERFSSWLRLLRTTCIILSFINKCKKLTGDINGDTMRRAEHLLIMYSQKLTFHEDLKNLKNKNTLERKSKLIKLSPFIDDTGILRVGGRISSAPGIAPETKHPVILDGRNHVTRLIVGHYHVKAAHGNQETVVNELKQKYWVIRMRPTIKHVTSKCMLCRIKKARPHPPRMGDLPEARMAHHQRAFTFCGVDLFGPMEVSVCRRREKRYGVLFTCMTVRAIHIEIVTKLTSDAFIMALRRMAARRGWPRHLFSDNGTNLRGADNELKRAVEDLDEDLLMREASNHGTTWTFSPPASPHWGGAWERLIRSVKESLRVVLKERAPRDEVLSTLLTEVEQIVNSRPLTHVSTEPHTDESLTPNHFLLHSSSNLPALGVFDESDTYLRKQWRLSQRLADLFWKRWVREVLPDMRPRTKWHLEQRPLQEGDLVVVVDPESPRGIWPRGRVLKAMPGKDGRVRVVDIKTKAGILRRSAARVAVIPTGDEC